MIIQWIKHYIFFLKKMFEKGGHKRDFSTFIVWSDTHIIPDAYVVLITQRVGRMKYEVPIYEKSNLTLEEAAAYFNIGINKLREITEPESCPFVLWVGSKRLIKRKALEEYLAKTYSI